LAYILLLGIILLSYPLYRKRRGGANLQDLPHPH